MKASELIDAIERFFLELIGTVIPGILIVGWIILLGRPRALDTSIGFLRDLTPWFVLVLGFVLGHFVTGISTFLANPGPLTKLA